VKDFSKLSNEELINIVNQKPFKKDYSSMSNEELMQLAGTTQDQSLPKISRAKALLTTSSNIPFAPRIKAGLATGAARLTADTGIGKIVKALTDLNPETIKDRSTSDLYNEALQNELNNLQQAREQYPVQSFISEIGANLPIPVKGVGGAIALGGAQAIGESKDLTNLKDVSQTGAIGSLYSAGGYGLGKSLNKLYNKFNTSSIKNMSADDVKTMANQAYKTAEQKGGILNESFINRLADEAKLLDKQTNIGKAIAGQTPINSIKEVLTKFKNQKLNLQSLQELDEALGDQIDKYVINGQITKEGLPILKLQNKLRDLVDNEDGFDALKEGRVLWSKQAKLRDIERIINRAEMSDNPATTIKAGFRTLFNNANKVKYFNKTEKKLIKKAATTGIITDSLRTIGSRLIPISSIVAGGGLPSTMASTLTSTASRNLASKLQVAKAEKLAEAIIAGKIPMPKKDSNLFRQINAIISAKLGSQSIYQPQQQQNYELQ
jgi:hypothetical protein